MTKKVRFRRYEFKYVDNDGPKTEFRRGEQLLQEHVADDDPYVRYLFGALHFDFNRQIYCEETLANIFRIRTGKLNSWSHTGDAFFTEIFEDRVEIHHVLFLGFGWPIWVCSLQTFETALLAWKRFLDLPGDENNEITFDLPSDSYWYKT